MSSVWHLNERDRLASEVARRIWVAHGGRAWANARDEGILLLLEAMVAKHLDEDVVRASLGLRYLEALTETICRVDYEDARFLVEEARWVELYLRRHALCSLLPRHEGDLADGEQEHVSRRRERLTTALVALAAGELRTAGAPA